MAVREGIMVGGGGGTRSLRAGGNGGMYGGGGGAYNGTYGRGGTYGGNGGNQSAVAKNGTNTSTWTNVDIDPQTGEFLRGWGAAGGVLNGGNYKYCGGGGFGGNGGKGSLPITLYYATNIAGGGGGGYGSNGGNAGQDICISDSS